MNDGTEVLKEECHEEASVRGLAARHGEPVGEKAAVRSECRGEDHLWPLGRPRGVPTSGLGSRPPGKRGEKGELNGEPEPFIVNNTEPRIAEQQDACDDVLQKDNDHRRHVTSQTNQ